MPSPMIPVHCVNPECKTRFSDTFVVESLQDRCPHCGLKNVLLQTNVIHLLEPNRFGLFMTRATMKRFNYCCDAANQGYRKGNRDPRFPIWYTTDPGAATCLECLQKVNSQLVTGEIIGEGTCPLPHADSLQAPTSGPTTGSPLELPKTAST